MVRSEDRIVVGVLSVLVVLLVVASATFIAAGGFSSLFSQEDAERVALEAVPGEVQEIELEEENGLLVYEVDVLADGSEKEVTIDQDGNVLGIEEEDADVAITGNALERASTAALAYIGEGEVTDSEIGDEEGYYEIEVTLDNGREVDVHLDEHFNVLSTEYD